MKSFQEFDTDAKAKKVAHLLDIISDCDDYILITVKRKTEKNNASYIFSAYGLPSQFALAFRELTVKSNDFFKLVYSSIINMIL